MNQPEIARRLSIAFVWLILILALVSCEDSSVTTPEIIGENGGAYDPVFSADGGFVITHGMLDKRYNEITFPGTHNSYAGADWA